MVGIPWWVGPRTGDRDVAGSIPSSPKVGSGSLFREFWGVSGSGLGTFSDGFGMVLKKISDGFEKYIFSKMARTNEKRNCSMEVS